MDSHSYQAAELGLDVIWWSDHDHRIASYRHVSRFGFDAWVEPITKGESWTSWGPHDRQAKKQLIEERSEGFATASGELTNESPFAGSASLRIDGSSPAEEFNSFGYVLRVWRHRAKRPLASGVRVHVAVRPEHSSPDAGAFISFELSEQAPREGLSFHTVKILYSLDNGSSDPSRRTLMS